MASNEFFPHVDHTNDVLKPGVPAADASSAKPRHYWVGLSDAVLRQSAAECRATGDPDLIAVAADIDDDLLLRQRRREQERNHPEQGGS